MNRGRISREQSICEMDQSERGRRGSERYGARGVNEGADESNLTGMTVNPQLGVVCALAAGFSGICGFIFHACGCQQGEDLFVSSVFLVAHTIFSILLYEILRFSSEGDTERTQPQGQWVVQSADRFIAWVITLQWLGCIPVWVLWRRLLWPAAGSWDMLYRVLLIVVGVLLLMVGYLGTLLSQREVSCWPGTFMPVCGIAVVAQVGLCLPPMAFHSCDASDVWYGVWHVAASAMLWSMHGFVRSLNGAEVDAKSVTQDGALWSFLLLLDRPPQFSAIA